MSILLPHRTFSLDIENISFGSCVLVILFGEIFQTALDTFQNRILEPLQCIVTFPRCIERRKGWNHLRLDLLLKLFHFLLIIKFYLFSSVRTCNGSGEAAGLGG
jgi:hypothetical protein